MTYEPKLAEKAKPLFILRNWGLGIIAATVGGRYILLEIDKVKNSLFDFLILGHLLVLFMTLILVFLWIWSTQKELDLCLNWLDPDHYIPPTNLIETIMIIGESILLCLLFWASFDPLFYAIIFALYSIIITITNKYALNEVHKAIKSSRVRLKVEFKENENSKINLEYVKGVDVLERFFILRPWMKRFIIIDIVSLLASGLGITWKITGQKFIGFITYIVIFLTILVSEIVIAKWRIVRDNRLRSIETEIYELKRNSK
jgi:hypothetical protein